MTRLATALTALNLVQLQPAELEDPAKGGGKPVFVLQPRLRLAQHYDLEVDLLIYDGELGTVGLVYHLQESGEKLEAEVENRIDRATYVRHLMLTHADSQGRLPLTVELVLLVPERDLPAVGTSLSAVARDSPSFLEAVGVSLLVLREGEDSFPAADLRRAFPWLLKFTEGWYSYRGSAVPAAPLQRIELQDYRLPGRRALDLGDSRVHLVFGHNGSGKSSLVEALELAVTGKVARIGENGDYPAVIRSRRAAGTEAAQVSLQFKDGTPIRHEVGPKGISDAFSPSLRATGFRLDQVVMDSLTRGNDTARANVFLESFFPDDHKKASDHRRHRQEAEAAFRKLPTALRDLLTAGGPAGEDPAAGILRNLAWLEDPGNPVPPAIASACRPLAEDTLQALDSLSPELAQLQAAWRQEPATVGGAESALSRLDEILGRLRGSAPAALDTLRSARQGLQQVAGWQAAGTGRASQDFVADLNGWLRHCALADLAEKHCQLLQSLREGGWEPDSKLVGPFAQPPTEASELTGLRAQAAAWASERDDFFQRVMTTAPATDQAGRPLGEVLPPSPRQKERLNEAGRWLSPTATDLLLGQVIEKAFAADNPVQFGDLVVGTGAWTDTLIARLSRLEEAAGALQALKAVESSKTFKALNDTRSLYLAQQEAGKALQQSFLRQLQGDPAAPGSRLVDALNELLALFTPARWAYEDINLKYQEPAAGDEAGGEGELVFQIGDQVQAALALNTAQLNLFTVALFLLCAVRDDNPLGLMVLDDPLQNMDELTVTTLARGIAKISRLWGENWRLLLFFHGQEDRDRFRREVPLASYQLPWMSLGKQKPGEPIEIAADDAVYDGGVQRLTEVAEPAPTVAGATPRSS